MVHFFMCWMMLRHFSQYQRGDLVKQIEHIVKTQNTFNTKGTANASAPVTCAPLYSYSTALMRKGNPHTCPEKASSRALFGSGSLNSMATWTAAYDSSSADRSS